MKKCFPSLRKGEVVVRVIEYSLCGSPERYRLLTTLLDPEEAPAQELAALYHERWEVELVFDELKVHLKTMAARSEAKPRTRSFKSAMAGY